ncbi:MAG: AraC family transcriptional regulator [Gammaproteobacteria bacterium]|nr:AraC family transcriptional regulator [Gammaproteobacteria bacterium]
MSTGNLIKLAHDRALYQGHLANTAWHRHGAPVLLVGLGRGFRVHLADGRVEHAQSALLDANQAHILESNGEPVASLFLEPDAPETQALRHTYLNREACVFDLVPAPTTGSRLERRIQSLDLETVLARSLRNTHHKPLDARIVQTLKALRSAPGIRPVRSQLAAQAGLSASRFNHLFSEQMGICFRRYRLWAQVRAGLMHLRPHARLTDLAHDTGFADSAHFSRTFRDLFGLPPSAVLKDLKTLEHIS